MESWPASSRWRRQWGRPPSSCTSTCDPCMRASVHGANGRPKQKAAGPLRPRRLDAKRGSVRVDARGLDDGAEARDLGLHELLVFGWLDPLVADHHGAQAFFLLDELGVLERHAQRVVELLENRRWCALGRVQAVPDRDLETLQAGFVC